MKANENDSGVHGIRVDGDGSNAKFEKQVKIQEKIDVLKQAGKKIPKSWIRNPFHLLYYKTRGLLDETR